MTLDLAGSVEADGARMVAALDANREAPIPWCGDWTVQECARHVGGLHHVVAGVIAGRPDANFGLFKTLGAPPADDPALGPWFAEGTAALVDQLRSVPADTPCWSFYAPNRTVDFWLRRTAHESTVHRWDLQRGAGVPVDAVEPELAADGVDEFLDVFTAMMRNESSPGAGETVHLHCTDTAGEWLIAFPEPGARVLTREHAKGDIAIRGSAESLLLFVWGRISADDGGIEIIGDPDVAARWPQLAPTV